MCICKHTQINLYVCLCTCMCMFYIRIYIQLYVFTSLRTVIGFHEHGANIGSIKLLSDVSNIGVHVQKLKENNDKSSLTSAKCWVLYQFGIINILLRFSVCLSWQVVIDTFIMIINSNRQHLFSIILSYYIAI